MEREVSTGNEPYIIVSSDTHAGLQCEQYREYLDPVLHAEFDEYVAERHEHRRISEELNGEFVKQWESEIRRFGKRNQGNTTLVNTTRRITLVNTTLVNTTKNFACGFKV